MGSHIIVLLISISGLLMSCNDTDSISDIEIAQQRWEAAGIENYRADIERICFCPPPSRYSIIVNKGSITRVVNTETSEVIDQDNGYSTVDELFVWLLEAAARNPEKLDLEFHPELGYPIFIDYNQSDMIADEEMLIRILDMQQL